MGQSRFFSDPVNRAGQRGDLPGIARDAELDLTSQTSGKAEYQGDESDERSYSSDSCPAGTAKPFASLLPRDVSIRCALRRLVLMEGRALS